MLQEEQKRHNEAKSQYFACLCFLLIYFFSKNSFPLTGWDWKPNFPHVHIYCIEFWASNFERRFYEIYDKFMAPLFSIIFKQQALDC